MTASTPILRHSAIPKILSLLFPPSKKMTSCAPSASLGALFFNGRAPRNSWAHERSGADPDAASDQHGPVPPLLGPEPVPQGSEKIDPLALLQLGHEGGSPADHLITDLHPPFVQRLSFSLPGVGKSGKN